MEGKGDHNREVEEVRLLDKIEIVSKRARYSTIVEMKLKTKVEADLELSLISNKKIKNNFSKLPINMKS
jgi:hypothetical protein